MSRYEEAKKIYELNFSVVKSIVAMLFVAHGTGLVTLFATDAVKYRTPLFRSSLKILQIPIFKDAGRAERSLSRSERIYTDFARG